MQAPDIETIDVPESAVALADDLDLPEVDLEEDIPLAADFDDFEAELANAFRQQASQPQQPQSPQPAARETYQHEFAGYEHRADIVAPAVGAALAAGAASAAASTAYTQVQEASVAPTRLSSRWRLSEAGSKMSTTTISPTIPC